MIQAVEVPLVPHVPSTGSKSFRPPLPGTPPPAPKTSAAPAPRLRPTAPATRNDAPASAAEIQPSPTDELGDMVAAQRSAAVSSPVIPAPPARKKIIAAANDPLFFRKTVIPILLTFGVVLAAWAVLILTAGEDNALGDMFPRWTPFVLLALAGIFWLLAIANMVAVRRDDAAALR